MSASRLWTLIDGVFQEGGSVPVSDRGFRYGMSVFETVAIRAGRMLLWPDHLDRLDRACAAAGFVRPGVQTWPEVRDLPDGMLRVYVTAGDGGPLARPAGCRVYALYDEAPFPSPGDTMQVVISRAPLSPDLGGWKTGNYWARVQAFAEARKQGADEALVFNPQGALISAAMANVFLVDAGRVKTPALSMGARDGAVRNWLMNRIPVEETLLTLEDVEKAGECFVTNSRLGVMPVTAIEGQALSSRQTGEALAALYREEIFSQ